MFALDDSNRLKVFGSEQHPFSPEPGWTIVSLGPKIERKRPRDEDRNKEADQEGDQKGDQKGDQEGDQE
jgi:hypothetical protein